MDKEPKHGRNFRTELAGLPKVLKIILPIIGLLLVATIVSLTLIFSDLHSLSGRLSLLQTNLASTTDELAKTNDNLSSGLNTAKQNVGQIQANLGDYQRAVGDISSTVNTLQKLSKTVFLAPDTAARPAIKIMSPFLLQFARSAHTIFIKRITAINHDVARF